MTYISLIGLEFQQQARQSQKCVLDRLQLGSGPHGPDAPRP